MGNGTIFHGINVLKAGKKSRIRLATISFITFFGLVMSDIALDVMEGVPANELLMDIALEGLVILTAAISVASLMLKYFEEKADKIKLQSNLDYLNQNQQEAARFLKQTLREQILVKFNEWNLTKSEQDVAIHLLKGLEIKAIADLRSTSEKTVSNQTQTIYEKSKLSGRTEFSAFFLQDILKYSDDIQP